MPSHIPFLLFHSLIHQVGDSDGGDEFSDGEEELVVPLAVEVIVPVVEVGPPGIVMGVDAAQEQHNHGDSCLQQQRTERSINKDSSNMQSSSRG